MELFPLLDLPSCVAVYLLSFVQDQDLIRCRQACNRGLIHLLDHAKHFKSDKNYIKVVTPYSEDKYGKKEMSIWPHVHHFVHLTHFEFVNARFSNFGGWRGHSKISFYAIDLIHLPKTLK